MSIGLRDLAMPETPTSAGKMTFSCYGDGMTPIRTFSEADVTEFGRVAIPAYRTPLERTVHT